MKRSVICLIVLLLSSTAAYAGVTYDFAVDSGAGNAMAGKAAISGKNMRLDFSKSDNVIFPKDSVVISTDGGETLQILNPKEKTYYEMEVDEIFAALGTIVKATGGLVKFKISNPNVTVNEAGAGETIEGYATRKYVIDSSYDMEIRVLGMKNHSSVQSHTESLVAPKLGDISQSFVQQKNFRTGLDDLDELVKAQVGAMKGFALKNVTTTTTTDKKGKKSVSTSTMTISGIKQTSVPDSQFKVPAGYSEVDQPILGMPSD